MKLGVLVFNLGGPESLRDVKPFLYRLFSDPEIIRIRWSPLRKIVAYAIATLRKNKSQGYYKLIGGGSPLRRLTEEQAAALESELRRRGLDAQSFVGMCTWKPLLSEAVERVEQSSVDRLVIMPLFPQYSFTTTRAGSEALRKLLTKSASLKALNTTWIRRGPNTRPISNRFLRPSNGNLRSSANPTKYSCFSALTVFPKATCAKAILTSTRRRPPWSESWTVSGGKTPTSFPFKARSGRSNGWSPRPTLCLWSMGSAESPTFLVVPISFVSEHIETLYELDILYQKVAKDAGIPNFKRVPALNSDPLFIRALADIVQESLQ
jgi:ferrochelatase